MKNHIKKLLFIIITILLPFHSLAEQADDRLVGKVRIKANLKLDGQARKDVAAAAARIKKNRGGTVKLKGIYPSATTAEEYLSKSVFMAREVERYLKTLLPPGQQIYTVTSQFSPQLKGGQNVVEIFFYPHELKPAEAEALRVNTLESRDAGKSPSVGADPGAPVSNGGAGVKTGADDGSVTYGRSGEGKGSEDAVRAEELVKKAKERAAEKARRKDAAD